MAHNNKMTFTTPRIVVGDLNSYCHDLRKKMKHKGAKLTSKDKSLERWSKILPLKRGCTLSMRSWMTRTNGRLKDWTKLSVFKTKNAEIFRYINTQHAQQADQPTNRQIQNFRSASVTKSYNELLKIIFDIL